MISGWEEIKFALNNSCAMRCFMSIKPLFNHRTGQEHLLTWFNGMQKVFLKEGQAFINESIIGSICIGKIKEVSTLVNEVAIILSIKGWMRIIGYNQIIIDDDDQCGLGFQVTLWAIKRK